MKQSIRALLLQKRNSIEAHTKAVLDTILHDKILEFLSNKKDKIIALYYSIGSEVDTHMIIHTLLKDGFQLALPAINEQDLLTFVKISSIEKLHQGKFCLEPTIIMSDVVMPDIIMIPLIAFDKNENRIGYGKGYYDKTLTHLQNAEKIGLAYAFQEIEVKNIYCNDVKLDYIITEQQAIYTHDEN